MPSTISTNMGLIVPTVGQEPGPAWANDLNASLGTIDQHNHSTGQGVQINPNGMNINADLPFNGNNLTTVKTVNFDAQIASLPGSTPNLGCVYVAGNELYYNDEAGNVVPITNNGSVNAGAGSITGLPSGTASASYSSGPGTFIWKSATNTAANMDNASVTIREQIANANGVTLNSPTSLAADYDLFFPAALPAGSAFLTVNSAGNIGDSISTAGGITGSNIANNTITISNATGILASPGSVFAFSQTTTGAYMYVVPASTFRLYARIVGGGGGGGGPSGTAAGGGGGGGGFMERIFEVVPGETLTIAVGAGTVGGSSGNNGGAGTDSTITGSTSGLIASVLGGFGGIQGGAGGAGGFGFYPADFGKTSGTGGSGIKVQGQLFLSGVIGTNSGGTHTGTQGGGGGASWGDGGVGGASGNNGGAGTFGGGGGGAGGSSTSGGSGADGLVQIYLV